MEAVKINKHFTKVTFKTKVNGKSKTLNLVFLKTLYKFLLKEKVFEQFINNTIAYRDTKDVESIAFEDMMGATFDFAKSPEGWSFWNELDEKFDALDS